MDDRKMYTSTESWGTQKFRNPGDVESRGWEGAASEVREEKERKGIGKGGWEECILEAEWRKLF